MCTICTSNNSVQSKITSVHDGVYFFSSNLSVESEIGN